MFGGLIGALTSLPASAEDPVSEDWQFQVAPYVWTLAAEGDVTLKGQKPEAIGAVMEVTKWLKSPV
jgi:hypothetical protein